MLINVINGVPSGHLNVSPTSREAAFIAANPTYVQTDYSFTESLKYYEYTNDTFSLSDGWETLKASDVAAATIAEETRNLPIALADKLAALKAHFLTVSERPRVVTTLGFAVDGNYNDLANFQIGKDLGLLAVKDADGVTRSIVIDDYDVILLAIKVRGLSLLQVKWTHEASIAALNTVATISAYDVTAGWPS